jgi:hypothetical protein
MPDDRQRPDTAPQRRETRPPAAAAVALRPSASARSRGRRLGQPPTADSADTTRTAMADPPASSGAPTTPDPADAASRYGPVHPSAADSTAEANPGVACERSRPGGPSPHAPQRLPTAAAPVRPPRRPWAQAHDDPGRSPGRLGAAAALVAAGVLAELPAYALAAALHGQIAVAVLFALLAAMLLPLWTTLRDRGLTRPVQAAAGLQLAAAPVLTQTIPFRVGVLSVVVYCAPGLLAAATAAARSRRARFAYAAAGVCLAAALSPLARYQRHVAAEQWITAQRVDPRLLQVVDLPGTQQVPYLVDPAARQLTAIYQAPIGPALEGLEGIGVETVTAGPADPCGPLQVATGDGLDTETPPLCVQIGPGLWQRGDDNHVDGYVLYRDGDTITLTGPDDPPMLLAALEAARPATDADLWTRIPAGPTTLEAWLLQ